jgi:hypothetical protein
MATTSVSASGTTGATCLISGPYNSSRNAKVTVFFKRGTKVPKDTDGANTTWRLVSTSSGSASAQ